MLAAKASEDAIAARALSSDLEVADRIVGFHAQQAVEKWLKAVLARNGIDFPRTHDLDFLVERLDGECGLQPPVALDQLSALTDFAVPLRYGDPVEDDEALDRGETLALVTKIEAWAQESLAP